MFVRQRIGTPTVLRNRETEIKRLSKKHNRLVSRGRVSQAKEVEKTITHLQALNAQGRGLAKPWLRDPTLNSTMLWS